MTNEPGVKLWKIVFALFGLWFRFGFGSGADCPLDTFHCGNGDCIDKRFVCDSVIDCRRIQGEIEGRDELECDDHENYCPDDDQLRRLPDVSLFRLIDAGYNIVKGGFSNIRMFQSERYTGGCQRMARRMRDGSVVHYRLPHNLLNWTFFDEERHTKVDFRLEVYESAHDAFVQARKHRTLSDPSTLKSYEDLYLHLHGLFGGDRMDSLQDFSRQVRPVESGYPIVRIVAEIHTGHYQLKSPSNLALHKELFLPQFEQAIRAAEDDPRPNGSQAEQRFLNIFRKSGTHYVSQGIFGGVYEVFVYRGDCDKRSGWTNVPYLAIQDIGKCAQALIKRQYEDHSKSPSWNIPECQNITTTMSSRIAPRKYDLPTKPYVSGGDPTLEKGLETAALIMDLPSALPRKEFSAWLRNLNDFPAPINLQLNPICDLITNDLSKSWNTVKSICQQALLNYVCSCDQVVRSRGCGLGDYGKSWRYSYICPSSTSEDCLSKKQSSGSCPPQAYTASRNGSARLGYHVTLVLGMIALFLLQRE